MSRPTVHRLLWVTGILAVGLVGAASGQGGGAPSAGSSMDQLLMEVRALRSEINQAAGASIRAQLLVARLQLQEQRINGIARQMADVQERLAGTERAVALLAAQLKQSDEPDGSLPPEERAHHDGMLRQLKVQLEQQRREEQDLRTRRDALSALLAEEQSRWSDLDARLDRLERELPARTR